MCALLHNIFLLFVTLLVTVNSIEPPQPKRKKAYSQDEKVSDRSEAANNVKDRFFSNLETNLNKVKSNEFVQQKAFTDCPPCNATKRNALQYAMGAFWRNDFLASYACACSQLQHKPEDGFAQSIVYSLSQSRLSYLNIGTKPVPPLHPAPPMRRWELLGPINVGKLEHDADATFQSRESNNANDVALHILSMLSNATVLSDIANGGTVKWTTTNANEQGEVSTLCGAGKTLFLNTF